MANSSCDRVVGYALTGFGRFCRKRLVPAFATLDDNRISAIMQRNTSSVEESAHEFGIPQGYTDIRKLVTDPAVDVVYVTSANALHESEAVIAAEAGKHVLCEKPLATTSRGCRHMIDACRTNGVKLMVAQNLRYSGAVLAIKDTLAEGSLGRPIEAQLAFTYQGAQSPRSWIYDRQIAGGGAMMDLGVHCLDILRFLLGEVTWTQSALQYSTNHPDLEDTVWVQMGFASGAVGRILCSYQSDYHNEIRIVAEHGTLEVQRFALPDEAVDLSICHSGVMNLSQVNTGNTYARLISSFSRSIMEDLPVEIPGEEGLANQVIIEEIYRTGQQIS